MTTSRYHEPDYQKFTCYRRYVKQHRTCHNKNRPSHFKICKFERCRIGE